MATEVFRLLGRITLDGQRTVERQLKSVDNATKTSAKAMSNMGRSYAESMKIAEQRLERYKDRFIEANDYMQAKSNSSSKMIAALSNQEGPINRMTAGFLRAGERLEAMAKAGSAANLAIQTLGRNASMKDLMDRMKMINQGIMRTQQLALGTTLIFAGMTAALVAGAKGPSVADVLEEQEKALANYQEAVKTRTGEILRTWAYFGKAEFEATKPRQIILNLESQVKAMESFNDDLAVLAKRLPNAMVQELREMGPEMAGTIHNLRGMTDKQLTQVVELWRRRHKEARAAALTELEGLRIETQEKIQQLQDSLTPLGIAAEKFKSTWAEALGPFVESFGKAAAAVVNFFTKIGEMWGAFNQANPELAKMVSWFIYLLPAIMAILSPLAVGIGYFKGLQAVLFATQALWKPFVLGFLRVVAPAAAVTAAIVGAAFAIKEMWENSAALREAFGGAMAAINTAVNNALAPLGFQFDNLKGAFAALIMGITGGAGTADSVFKTMGDTIAGVINWLTANIFPILSAGLEITFSFIGGIIKAVIPFINQFAMVFMENAGTIKTVVSAAFTVIGFIVKVVMVGLVGTIQTYLGIALTIFKGVMNLINGVIQIFRGIMSGNWSLIWSGIVDVLKGAMQIIWGFIQISLLGRVMAIIRRFASMGLGLIRGFGSAIGGVFKTIGSIIGGVWTVISNMIVTRIRTAVNLALTSGNMLKTGLATAFNFVLGAAKRAFGAVKTAIMTPINSAVTAVKTKIGEIKGFFTGLKMKIPKINLPPMPKFELEYGSKTVMGKKIEYPTGFDVSWHAKGGVFNGPSIIGVGEQPGVPEMLTPLSGANMKPFANAIAAAMPGGGFGGRIIVETPVYIDRRQVAKAVSPEIDLELQKRTSRSKRARGEL